ncbi:MAG: TasA family protein [Dehalococcoidales bacterium]|nr:TasA family protein [Dehalococcoidales bacterium]
MKRKIIGMVAAISVVAVLLGTGTWAFFSDTETSTGNVFEAGTIDLAIAVGEGANENPWTSTIDGLWEDYKPNQTVAAAQITLENVGTNPMDVWMKITKGTCTGGASVYPPAPATPVASSEPEWVESGDASYAEKCDIDTVIRYELTVGGTPKITYADDYTISENTPLVTTGIDTYYIWIGNIAAAGTITVDQNFKMDSGTTNWAQGDTMPFTIEFYAQQSEGDTQPVPLPDGMTELALYERSTT